MLTCCEISSSSWDQQSESKQLLLEVGMLEGEEDGGDVLVVRLESEPFSVDGGVP